MAKKYSIPDEKIAAFGPEEIETYINGLYYSGQEMSCDWSKGHKLLKLVGFKEITDTYGHRSFVSLEWDKK